MKLKETGLMLLVVFLVAFGLITCSGNVNSELVGKWVDENNVTAFEITKTQIILDFMQADYKIERGSIMVSWMGGTLKWADSFEFVDNDTLKLIGAGDNTGTYKRHK